MRRKSTGRPEVKFSFSTQKMTVYKLKGCPACDTAINTLKEHKIPFIVKDYSENKEEIKKITKGCKGIEGCDAEGYKYAPVILNKNGVFIGGNVELNKLISDL